MQRLAKLEEDDNFQTFQIHLQINFFCSVPFPTID